MSSSNNSNEQNDKNKNSAHQQQKQNGVDPFADVSIITTTRKRKRSNSQREEELKADNTCERQQQGVLTKEQDKEDVDNFVKGKRAKKNEEVEDQDDQQNKKATTSQQQVLLSDVIKSHHQKIRDLAMKQYQGDGERAWADILQDQEALNKYADAMHSLATQFWDTKKKKKPNSTGDPEEDNSNEVRGEKKNINEEISTVTTTTTTENEKLKRKGVSKKNNLSIVDPQQQRYDDRLAYALECIRSYFIGIRKDKEEKIEIEMDSADTRKSEVVPLLFSHPHPDSCEENRNEEESISLLLHFSTLPLILSMPLKVEKRRYFALQGTVMPAQSIPSFFLNYQKNVFSTNSPKPRQKQQILNQGADNDDAVHVTLYPPHPIKILDVGSCYNPLKQLSNYFQEEEKVKRSEAKGGTVGEDFWKLTVDAIDLAPFPNSGVHPCDWMQVEFISNARGNNPENEDEKRKKKEQQERIPSCSIPNCFSSSSSSSFRVMACSYDVVLFCLLLSYLPTAPMRFKACIHAYNSLKPNGLLILISTRTQGSRSAQWVQAWIEAIESIGCFKRVHKNLRGKIIGLTFRKGGLGGEIAQSSSSNLSSSPPCVSIQGSHRSPHFYSPNEVQEMMKSPMAQKMSILADEGDGDDDGGTL